MPEMPKDLQSPLNHFLRVLWRRRWIALVCLIVVPAAAFAFSLRQEHLYSSSASVYLSNQNIAGLITGATTNGNVDPERAAATQARLGRAPAVAEGVLRALHLSRSADDFLSTSSVSADPSADLLKFTVTDPDAALAPRMATEYARQFTKYRLSLDTEGIQRALGEVTNRLAVLQRAGGASGPAYASLLDKEQQLRTIEALQTSNAFLVNPADRAEQVQPKTLRNTFIALALGAVLGIGLALLWEAIDTRVRSAEEAAELLGLTLLARLPEPSKRLRASRQLGMLEDPLGPGAEAVRILRTNLEFVNIERGARTIMITSAVAGEGKSTTIANLAVALAQAGRTVVLVDLDLRRPMLAQLFGLAGHAGVTDVAIGDVTLEEALTPVSVLQGKDGEAAPLEESTGRLEVLPGGPTPPNVGEFVGGRTLAAMLTRLKAHAEFVLIDAPPLIGVGDAITLSRNIEGQIMVVRLGSTSRRALAEARRLIAASPAPPLGFIVSGAEADSAYAYAGAHYYAPAKQPAVTGPKPRS